MGLPGCTENIEIISKKFVYIFYFSWMGLSAQICLLIHLVVNVDDDGGSGNWILFA